MAPSYDGDYDEHILREMYVPIDASQSDLVDLVFVHGLGGNLRRTWKQEGTDEPWFTKPEFLGPLASRVRTLSFGYNANKFDDVANTRIIDHANDLLRNLVLKRLDNADRPLIFIAHSLGGLVVKRAILLCATVDDWSAIKESTKSIIFMGTPHMGSERAEDLVVVQKLASFMKLQAPIATNLTKELRPFSTAIQDINKEFTMDVHRSIELLCCYESLPQRLPNGSKEIIVPQWSSILQGANRLDLKCTHSGLPKFSSPSEPRFELFWGEVQRLVKKATAPFAVNLIHSPSEDPNECMRPLPLQDRPAIVARRRQGGRARAEFSSSTAAVVRSSVNGFRKELKNMLAALNVAKNETEGPEMEDQESLEAVDPREFEEFSGLLRTFTPENQAMDRESPHRETCKWILRDHQFTQWKESKESGFLFITGRPGCGKSSLAKYIQRTMETLAGDDDGDNNLVISFYCDSLESSRSNAPVLDLLLRSLLSKPKAITAPIRGKLHTLFERFLSNRSTKTGPGIDSEMRLSHLMEVLQTLVGGLNGLSVCLIVDGLDQCTDEFTLSLLRGLDTTLRRCSDSAFKVLITSRMTNSIRGFALQNSHIEMNLQLVGEDIQLVVDDEVERILLSRRITTIDQNSVSAVIVERANDSFLFASCVLKELWRIQDTGANSVFTLLTSCPSTMEAIYQQDIAQLQAERPDLLKLVQFVCIARRTLRITEAREILRLQNPAVTEYYDLEWDLARMCQRLIKLGNEGTIELLHETVYDYITKAYDVSLIHESFAEMCLEYLSTVDWDDALQRRTDRKGRPGTLPFYFLSYASYWMGAHWQGAGSHATKKAWDLWNFMTSDNGGKWESYVQALKVQDLQGSSQESHSQVSSASTNSFQMANTKVADDEGQMEVGEVNTLTPSVPTANEATREILCQEGSALLTLAQLDVDEIIKELFLGTLDSLPKQLLHSFLRTTLYRGMRSPAISPKKAKDIVNQAWGETTAVHWAAAGSGRTLEVLLPFVSNVNCLDSGGCTPLHLAAYSGQLKAASLLLQAGADVNHADKEQNTALFFALINNTPEMVQLLLQNGADPDIIDRAGYSPLEIVIVQNNLECARILLEHSPDIKALMIRGLSAAEFAWNLGSYEVLEALLPYIDIDLMWHGDRLIHLACCEGLDKIVQKLVSLGANVDDPPVNFSPLTPVQLAVFYEHSAVLDTLLASGAKFESSVSGAHQPLHSAAGNGNLDICRKLVHAGCNIDAEGEGGATALGLAVNMLHFDVVKFLVGMGADTTKPSSSPPIQMAASKQSCELVDILLSARVPPDLAAVGDTGWTALGTAAKLGNLPMVTMLLDHGADPNLLCGKVEKSPLSLVMYRGNDRVVIELLERGATCFPESPSDRDLFHQACGLGSLEVMKTFLGTVKDASILVNYESAELGTPLFQAACGGQLDAVRFLLQHGADPNYKATAAGLSPGATLLHAAALGGNVEVLQAILAVIRDKSLDTLDSNHTTPLSSACWAGNDEMAQYLLEIGSRTDIASENGWNLTHSLACGGSTEILNRILEKSPEYDTDAPTQDLGMAPLLLATANGNVGTVALLLKRGADVNRCSNLGYFPLSESIQFLQKNILQLILEHRETDVAKRDHHGQNGLQMALYLGRDELTPMILAAANDRGLEAELMGNKDMYGKTVFDYTDFGQQVSWGHCIEAIRKDAELILHDFSPKSLAWERLGKLLLQLSAYSFAQVTFQRGIQVKTAPVVFEQKLGCHGCHYLLKTTRFTCKSCCNVNLCEDCLIEYLDDELRFGLCRYHTFFRISLPTVGARWGLEEEASLAGDGSRPREIQSVAEDETDDDATSSCLSVTTRRKTSEPPSPCLDPSLIVHHDAKENDIRQRDLHQPEAAALNEYQEPTEEQLRHFLNEILRLFTPDQTPEGLVKWEFAVDKWRCEYDDQATLREDRDERHPDVFLHPNPQKLKPQSEAYNYLSGMAYLLAGVPSRLPLTCLEYDEFACLARRKKTLMQEEVCKEMEGKNPCKALEMALD